MNIEEFRQYFERKIADASSPIEKNKSIAMILAAAFGVGSDEVAIFSFDKSREVLVFVWPDSLKSVGSIPLSAHRCLVARTAVENRGELDNSFASSPHLYMFEYFLSEKEKRVPIQKIMSVPLVNGAQFKGVVQIARKGADRESAGADFSARDLDLLTAIATVIANYL